MNRALHRILALAALLPLTSAAAPPERPADEPGPDARALEVARSLYRELGGPRLENRGYLAFTFIVEDKGMERARFRHHWNRRTQDYRVEGDTREGPVRVIFNLDTRKGRAQVAGQEVRGEALERWLQFGYGRFINDTYWLLVPFKLQDPGVHLSYEGERREDGRRYALLHLSFDNVGLTPGDQYSLWVDTARWRVDRWDMLLQGREPPPITVRWEGWIEVDGVWFSTRRVMDGRAVVLADIELADRADPELFSLPDGE